MNNQKVNPTSAKRQLKVDLPGQAPAVGPAPKKFRSSSMAPQVNAPSTRAYGKGPQFGPPRGFNTGGAI